MKYRHSHAINILEHTSKYLALLIFPAIRALFASNNGFYSWLQGAWFDLTVVALIILLGFWAWYKYVYKLTENGIYIKQGIILPKYRSIPYKKLSVVSIERPFYLLPFKAVRINADTDGGNPRTPDFAVTVYKNQVDDIVKMTNAPFINYAEIKKVYLPKNFYIAVLSFVASNSLTGVIFASTFISGMGRVLGDEFESTVMTQLTTFASLLVVGVPPAAAILGLAILGGWAVSFVGNLIRHLKFSATRQSGSLFIQSGLMTRREYYISVNRINLIELRQTLITKILGFYTGFIHSNGYGKRKDELSVLMPSGEAHDIAQNVKLLLPEIPICKTKLNPRLKYLSRFLIPPIWCVIIASAFWVAGYWFIPAFPDLVLYLGLMAELPCLWYLAVKIISYFHTGVGESDGAYTFCYTYGYRIKTVAVPKQRIVKLIVRRSLVQVMSGCCDLVIYTFSEGKKRHVVPNLNFEDAKKIMGVSNYYRN